MIPGVTPTVRTSERKSVGGISHHGHKTLSHFPLTILTTTSCYLTSRARDLLRLTRVQRGSGTLQQWALVPLLTPVRSTNRGELALVLWRADLRVTHDTSLTARKRLTECRTSPGGSTRPRSLPDIRYRIEQPKQKAHFNIRALLPERI
jgi:hypothetical protein